MKPARDTVIIIKKATLQTKSQPIAVKTVLAAPVTLITVATLAAILAAIPVAILVATLVAIPVAIPVVVLVAVKTEVERHQLRNSLLQDCSYRI